MNMISSRNMDGFQERASSNGFAVNNGHCDYHTSTIKSSLSWLGVRVFYVRLCKCEIDESTPDHLTLNHVPLSQDTLLEVNGVRTSIYSDGAKILLRRDRVDRKSEEVTYVSTDSIRMTGSVKFEVCYKDVLVLSGSLRMSESNGFSGGPESRSRDHLWSMDCESSIMKGDPAIEVYVAGSFLGSPIILSKTIHLGQKRKNTRKAMLVSIPEYDASEYRSNGPSSPSALRMQVVEESEYKREREDYNRHYPQYVEGEDEELTWFNAGVRVGVGLGLSACLGVGIGVGLVVKAYQGTTRNFRSRLF